MTTITPVPPDLPVASAPEPLHGPAARKAVRRAFSSPIASLVITIIAIVWTIPTLGLFINSFRSKQDAAGSGWWEFFAHPSLGLSNYHHVLFAEGGTILPLVNSLAITIPATIIPIFIASMAAYALAWVRFRGSDVIFFTIFALQIVPLQMALVPLQRLYNFGGHIGSVQIFPGKTVSGLAEIWVSHTMFSLPLAIFLLHNFISQLPESLIEAARVDGANHLRIYRSIVLPLAGPAIASFTIFQFIWVWNDLLVAKIFGGSDTSSQPITARAQILSGSYAAHPEYLAPLGFITIVVPLLVFLVLQRFFVRGLLAGSVKG
jgi:alpha-glucoside transport system permease protein